tara:strand:+ start:921 stop:1853 length:933 start_codon:yes stop_codon:yes gene_type:complete
LRGLAINFTSTHQVGNSAGISKVGENKQLLITIVPVAQLLLIKIKKREFNSFKINIPLSMQGKKEYKEKLFTHFQLSDYVPEDNFYRRLKQALSLDFLYVLTKPYYGNCGQKSIDPTVFFKLMLVGYLENLTSDRHLMSHCKMRLDILYFLGYDIDQPLPWHSTLSRTRQLFPESLYEDLFHRVLILCIESGMVSGHTQAIDSAPVKANASMDSLELKIPEESLEEYLNKYHHISKGDKSPKASRKAKQDKSEVNDRKVSASEKELKEISARTKRWSEEQDQRPGSGNKHSKYVSNTCPEPVVGRRITVR